MRWRLKLEGETENMRVCTKERKGVTAAVLMATPCTNSLGGESGGQRHDDDDDVYYYIRWRLKLEGETENMGVCTIEVTVTSLHPPHLCRIAVCSIKLTFSLSL